MPIVTFDPDKIFSTVDFTGLECVIAAVSGGSDSLALLLLLKSYFQQQSRAPKLVAITIDHQLRPESADEARYVGMLCAQLGVPHQTLCWTDKKPETGLSHAARLARYRLLAKSAQAHQAGMILTGHTLDDQAETYFMRLNRGHGRGLAAMAEHALLYGKIILQRPLLAVRRQQLRNYLDARNIRWIDDPSNDNPHYERVRMRQSLDHTDIETARLAVARARRARQAQSFDIARQLDELSVKRHGAQITLHSDHATRFKEGGYNALVALLASLVGGNDYVRAPNSSLIDFFKTSQKQTALRRLSWAGAIIEHNGPKIRLWRENRNLVRLVLPAGHTCLWDNRYKITSYRDDDCVIAPPTDAQLHQAIKQLRDLGRTPSNSHFPSLRTSCAITGKQDMCIPLLSEEFAQGSALSACFGLTIERILQPFGWLVSGDDLAMLRPLEALFQFRVEK